MAEEPEQVLPEQHVAVAGDLDPLPADDQAARQEEARVRQAIHPLQHRGGLQGRKGQEQQERGDELRPDEERQPEPGQPGRAQLNDGGDEVQRAQQRRKNQAQHADQPEGLSGGAKSASGGYDVQPDIGAPPGAKKLASMTRPPTA